jgi:transposase-like protein
MNDNKNKIEFKKKEKVVDRYDKRLILQVVKEIEEGLPRKEAITKYSLGKSTLSCWLLKYGSANYHKNKRKSYSRIFKRQVIAAIINKQMTYQEAMTTFKIDNIGTIRSWVEQSKKEKLDICILNNSTMAKKLDKHPEPSVEELKAALKMAEMKVEALNTLIDVADDYFKINIRKKSGAKQSSN